MRRSRCIRWFIADETGSMLTDYAVLAGVMTIAILGALTSIGDQVRVMFEGVLSGFGNG